MGPLGIRGNLDFQERLLRYLSGGKIHPAIILAGPAMDTKVALAKNVAKRFLCEKQPDCWSQTPPFCGDCSSCRRIEKGVHPDVITYLEPEEAAIKIETIRDIAHQMTVQPLEGRAKICIIDECHRLLVPAANAFLKTLEEPGPNRYFWLLTSQVGALLPTIVSRCLQFYLKPEERELSQNKKDSLLKRLSEYHTSGKLDALGSAATKKDDCLELLQFLQSQWHAQAMANPDAETTALEAFEAVIEIEARLRSNANYGLMLENLLTRYPVQVSA